MTNQHAIEAAYQAAHVEADCLTDRILDLIHDLPASGNDRQPVDWSHVGSLNEVNRRLQSVVAFLQNTEE